MFGFKKKEEIVKVVYVPTPKTDLGTRIKKMDFDPFSLAVGAAVPLTVWGGIKATKAINEARIIKLATKAAMAEVPFCSTFVEYSADVRDYLFDSVLLEGLSGNQKAHVIAKVLCAADAYCKKQGIPLCTPDDEESECDCEECTGNEEDPVRDEVPNVSDPEPIAGESATPEPAVLDEPPVEDDPSNSKYPAPKQKHNN